MRSKIQVAAIQMDANPASVEDRLLRAEHLVIEAARLGAQLVVLPELFSVGYTYADSNYQQAESLTGPSISWMGHIAERLSIHLAGSVLLRDRDEVYNALLLRAPDGRMWRYDKIYPWGWERSYFGRGREITIADTGLGRIGMMVCWDAGHPGLWRRYAGQVDLMAISSCPPNLCEPIYRFPGGETVTQSGFGPVFGPALASGERVFGEMIEEQAAWLGVPVVNSVGCGQITTAIPRGRATLLSAGALAPWLLRYLPQADAMQLSCGFMEGCKVVDGLGNVVSQVSQEQGECFATGEVALPEKRALPRGRQPASGVHPFAYLASDVTLPWLMVSLYRQGLRRVRRERGST